MKIDPKEITIVGQTNFRGQRRAFGIYPDDRRRHVYLIGKTGVGKTTLIQNMLIQDIESGKGLALVDPHGDVAEAVLNAIPPHRINDVVYFNPSDIDYPVAFNVLEAIDPRYKYLVASGLVSSLKKIWADSWGPRLEYILRNVILALLDYPNSTMLGIMRMLSDKDYRKKVVDAITDPVVKSFWVNEFANYNERFRSEAISPIQNKVGQFLSSSIVRNIVAQPKSSIDMKDIMDNGKILIVNVSKGKIGEDNSALLGAMLITKIQLAAMDRASIPEDDRRDFYLYVDEFQNFATESFATILSEARKYHLNLIIAHQYITQMEEPVRDAVFGNVGTMIAFRIGAFDAEYMEREYAPEFTAVDLVNLDKYNAYVKLMINGITSKPFSMLTIAPVGNLYNNFEKVVAVSRERYGRRRDEIEDNIARWSGVEPDTLTGSEKPKEPWVDEAKKRQENPPTKPAFVTAQPVSQAKPTESIPPVKAVEPAVQSKPVAQKPQPVAIPKKEELVDIVLPKSKEEITDLSALLSNSASPSEQKQVSLVEKKSREMFPTICSRCKKNTEVPFKPNPEKEVFCAECFVIVKEERKKNTQPQLAAQ